MKARKEGKKERGKEGRVEERKRWRQGRREKGEGRREGVNRGRKEGISSELFQNLKPSNLLTVCVNILLHNLQVSLGCAD